MVHVFLIHGMGRTPLSMWLLKQRLTAAGHSVSLFGYAVTFETLEAIGERFVEHIGKELGDRGIERYAVVGHSLGNIITRYSTPRLPSGFERFVMLAPPNQGAVMARALKDNWLFRAATQDAGQKLTDAEFFASLPTPDVPSKIIAGTRGPRVDWLPFRGAVNDSIVSLEETRLGDIPVEEVHAAHSFLMNRRDVFERVQAFLQGDDDEPADGAESS